MTKQPDPLRDRLERLDFDTDRDRELVRAALHVTDTGDPEDVRLDALDHHAGWCACRAKGWLADVESKP